jgi:hypothetical protein
MIRLNCGVIEDKDTLIAHPYPFLQLTPETLAA